MNRVVASLALSILLGCTSLVGCSSSGMVDLPDLPPCPGPDCTCDSPDDCRCDSRSACALSCGDDCQFHCEEDSECASAAGDNADLECVEDTTCTLYTGANSNVTCTAAACTVEVGPGSAVRCRDRGQCNVTCTGACTVQCEGATTCATICGDAEPVSGDATCS